VGAFLGGALGEVFGDEELLMGLGALRPSRTHSPSSSSSNSADDFDILSNGTSCRLERHNTQSSPCVSSPPLSPTVRLEHIITLRRKFASLL
jgi:hypothetical protein